MKFLIGLTLISCVIWASAILIDEIGDYADETNPHNKNRDN